MDNNWVPVVAIAVSIVVIAGVIYLFRKNKTQAQTAHEWHVVDSGTVTRSSDTVPEGAKQYRNTETIEIEWNDDCLPTKIIHHRDAYQL